MAAPIVFNVAKNNIDISDLRVLLLVGYTPDPDHATVTAVIAAATKECDFTNYARKALGSEAWSVVNATDRGKLAADNPATWEDAGGTTDNLVSHMVVYEHHGADDSGNIPVSSYEVGKNTNGGDLAISFSADGILYTT